MPELCYYCHGQITDSVVRHENHPYHDKCFSCFHCRIPLAGKTFQMKDDKKVCKDCYCIYYGKLCRGCRNFIEGDAKFVTREDGTYHSDCLVCGRCFKTLVGKTYREHEGKLVCEGCFEIRYADRCDVCRGALGVEATGEYVKYDGKCYHNECFVCYRCRKPLSGLSNFRIKNNHRMCIPCADRH